MFGSQWELEEVAAGRRQNTVYGVREGGPAGGPLAVGLTDEHVKAYGIEFVVGAVHWPMYVRLERGAVSRDHHRQIVFLASHPLVDIVGHPWWWMGPWRNERGMYEAEPWFDDFGIIPQSMHDEFAAAAVEHGTAVEINLGAMLLSGLYSDRFRRQYLDYLGGLAERGVRLAIGSDCHDANYSIDFATAGQMLDSVGITEGHLWRLPPRQ